MGLQWIFNNIFIYVRQWVEGAKVTYYPREEENVSGNAWGVRQSKAQFTFLRAHQVMTGLVKVAGAPEE
jgi:hypothetical protein